MHNATVLCGCTRTMTPDGARGRGAYRCGCGARVKITIPPPTSPRCAASPNGEPCRSRPTITDPLPLCEDHYVSTGLKNYHEWRGATPPEVRDRVKDMFLTKWQKQLAEEREHDTAHRPQPTTEELEADGVVYFIRSRDQVKIGTTLKLRERITSFSVPHITLLATEPGYKQREKQLHQRFASLRVRSKGEWYRLASPLTEHINAIRKHHGLPPVAP